MFSLDPPPDFRKPQVRRQPYDISPPSWIVCPDGYCIRSCRMHEWRGNHSIAVYFQTKPSNPEFGMHSDYAKVYAVDDFGNLFPQMDGIYSELSKMRDYWVNGFRVSPDGRITDAVLGGGPNQDHVKAVADSIMALYDRWKQFPTADNWELVGQLEEALNDVQRMKNEEKYGDIKQNIEKLREVIKRAQDDISKLEGSLTAIYEKAADGMNLLEEHGVKVELDETEPELDNITSGEYVGFARIMEDNYGTCHVLPISLSRSKFQNGDMVKDSATGKVAIYCNGIWNKITMP